MGIFFVYILKSSACLAVFYLFYKLLLSRDTFHRFNRIALLGIIILSVIIPFCEVTLGEVMVVRHPVMDIERLLLAVPTTGIGKESGQPWWLRALMLVYMLGGIAILCLFIHSFYNLYQVIGKGTSSVLNGIRLITTDQPVSPFSWMHTIVINDTDYKESGQEILTHEIAHVKAYHSMDLLILNICILFHWFNPAAWLIQRELRNIHEYEADESVLNQGIDAKRYQLLLIKKAVGSQRFTSMANSFNHNSLKKRIAMMLRQKSNPWARLKYLYVLPLAAITIAAFARPEISRELEKISSAKFSDIIPLPEIIPADSTQIISIHKPKVEVTRDTLSVVSDPIMTEQIEQTTVYLDEEQSEIQEQVEEAMAVAKINETVEAEIAKHQPEIDKAIQEAMANAKVAEQIEAEMEKVRPLIEKAVEEAMETAKVHEKIAAEMEKHKPALEAAARQMTPQPPIKLGASFKGIVFIDGMESTTDALEKLNPERINVMNVWKGEKAVERFGEKAQDGAIEIITKK